MHRLRLRHNLDDHLRNSVHFHHLWHRLAAIQLLTTSLPDADTIGLSLEIEDIQSVDTTQHCQQVLDEISNVLQQVNNNQCEALIQALRSAPRIYLTGMGRGGLSIKAFAMRLMHLGFEAFVVGEINTPRLRSGDLMLIASFSGETGTSVHLARKAIEAGATLALITASPGSTLAGMADVVVHLNAKNTNGLMVTRQPMLSLYEQSLLLFGDALVLRLMETCSVSEADMLARHTNLE